MIVRAGALMIVGNGRPNGHIITPCELCPLRKRPSLREFTPEELAFVKHFKSDELRVDPGASFLREGTSSEHLYTVLHGWAFRYKMLDDGRRQILNYALPADMVGLQGTLMREMEHSVEALTPLVLCVFPRSKLYDLYSQFPSLAFDITWLAAREEQLIDEHLFSLGRRTALERTAYLLLHLYARADEAGLTRNGTHSVSIHPAASCRHARHVAGAHQQDAQAVAGVASDPLEGPRVRDDRSQRAGRDCRRRRRSRAGPGRLFEVAALGALRYSHGMATAVASATAGSNSSAPRSRAPAAMPAAIRRR